jgi:PTS system N-acetylglucosamine-specific IIC component
MDATAPKRGFNLGPLQKFGRSLMLPIASLPAAALMLRLGQADLLGVDGLGWDHVATVIGAGGSALFVNLGFLFAVGVAIGMAKKADGSTALAAVVGYLVFQSVSQVMSPYVLDGVTVDEAKLGTAGIQYGVLGGIVIGLITAYLWQKYHRIKLPAYLAFFGGRRFVPIITSFVAIAVAVLMGLVYPIFDDGLTSVGDWVTDNDIIGGFVYGTLNRLLIPLGLHHILNSGPWFLIGTYKTGGVEYHGDIARFLNGDPSAGAFMTGFFPIMMFALPAAALAIWREAKPAQKKAVGGIMLSAALCSFLTGVTEPLEFAFMFVAWPLYVLHALLTGTSLALVNALNIKDGFGFSAGFFDYALNFNIATRPLWLIVIGLGYAVVYYFSFRFVIRKWNLRTPGREEDGDEATDFITADTSE